MEENHIELRGNARRQQIENEAAYAGNILVRDMRGEYGAGKEIANKSLSTCEQSWGRHLLEDGTRAVMNDLALSEVAGKSNCAG